MSVRSYLPEQPDNQGQQDQSRNDAAGDHSHGNVALFSGLTDRQPHLQSSTGHLTVSLTALELLKTGWFSITSFSRSPGATAGR